MLGSTSALPTAREDLHAVEADELLDLDLALDRAPHGEGRTVFGRMRQRHHGHFDQTNNSNKAQTLEVEK